MATDYQCSGWLLSGVLPAYEEHGTSSRERREERTTYCLECCDGVDPRICSEKEQSNQELP